MNNHETILRMIEEVDPKDENALREIDARVHCWYNYRDCEFISMVQNEKYYFQKDNDGCVITNLSYVPPYTTSRDAIKSIRPDGWGTHFTTATKEPLKFWAMLRTDNPEDKIKGNYGVFKNDIWFDADSPSEELAELHATIQAIAYERQKGNDDD